MPLADKIHANAHARVKSQLEQSRIFVFFKICIQSEQFVRIDDSLKKRLSNKFCLSILSALRIRRRYVCDHAYRNIVVHDRNQGRI